MICVYTNVPYITWPKVTEHFDQICITSGQIITTHKTIFHFQMSKGLVILNNFNCRLSYWSLLQAPVLLYERGGAIVGYCLSEADVGERIGPERYDRKISRAARAGEGKPLSVVKTRTLLAMVEGSQILLKAVRKTKSKKA